MNIYNGENEYEIIEKIYTLDEIAEICKPIFRKFKLKKVYVFGSYSRNEAKPTSDVDFLVVGRFQGLFKVGGFVYELERALSKEIDVVSEKYFIEDTKHLGKPAQLADKIFYDEVLKDRRLIYSDESN